MLSDCNIKAFTENFNVRSYQAGRATLRITEPYSAIYEGIPVGYSSPAIDKEIEIDPSITDFTNLNDSTGKLLLCNQRPNYEQYNNLKKNNAEGIAIIAPPFHSENCTCFTIEAVERSGLLYGISLPYQAGLEMAQRQAKRGLISIDTAHFINESTNVIAKTEGTKPNGESILICGHLDSVMTSTGMMDNAAGCAIVLYLATIFTQNPVKRDLIFVLFGSEEWA
jgi:hypothetical protein